MVTSFLDRSPLYVMMLESVRLGNADVLCEYPDGMTLRDRPSGAVMTAALNAEAAARMAYTFEKSELLTAHDCYTRDIIARMYPNKSIMSCHQAVYLADNILRDGRFDIHPLTNADIDVFIENYAGYDDADYEMERARSGVMRGAHIGGKLAGYIGRHAEGSIGMLGVLPEYRRRGVGEVLLRHMVGEFLSEGRRPFSQIVQGNSVSEALHKKLGFTITDELLYWFT